MLTVKHIMPSGDEAIYPAREVRKSPASDPGSLAIKSAPEALWIDPPTGETRCLGSWGSFYVMNDEGKTVAKYDFGGWDSLAGEAGIIGVAASRYERRTCGEAKAADHI